MRTRSLSAAAFCSFCLAFGSSAVALAQQSPIPDSIRLGNWTFRPMLDVRIRGEYKRQPIDVGGDRYTSTAVLLDAPGSGVPPAAGPPASPVVDQWLVGERIRLGMAIEHGPITAAVSLQDARILGTTDSSFSGPSSQTPPSFGPWEAYLDVRSKGATKVFARVGRQRVVWGDGRLVGESDFSPTARSLDAARGGAIVGPFEIEGMAAFLAPPGDVPPNAGSVPVSGSGLHTGAQLYGLDAIVRIHPLFNIEATGLARFARVPTPASLTPSDVVVVDGRIFGEHRGFRYAAEGAYEAGRVAAVAGEPRNLEAFAFAARAQLETALWGHLTFSAQGAYASGDNGSGTGTLNRFDPILPEEYQNHGMMGLTSWSNLIEAGGDIALRPLDELTLVAGYRFDMLADAKGRWTQGAALLPIGAAPTNTSQDLGHEIDVKARIVGWEVLNVDVGYGLFLFGDGAKNLLEAAHKGRPDMQHWGYLQARVRMP